MNNYVKFIFAKYLSKRSFVILTIVLIILAAFISVDKVYATEEGINTCNTIYSSVQVLSGDTLSSICDTYYSSSMNISIDEYISQVKELNNISYNSINIGAYIIVPQIEE